MFFHENYLKIFFSIKQERCRPIHKYYIIKIKCINFDFNINNLHLAKYCTRVCSTLLFITILEIWAPGFKYDNAGILPLERQQNEHRCLPAMEDNIFFFLESQKNVLNISSNFNRQCCILILQVHIFHTICCTCMPMNIAPWWCCRGQNM